MIIYLEQYCDEAIRHEHMMALDVSVMGDLLAGNNPTSSPWTAYQHRGQRGIPIFFRRDGLMRSRKTMDKTDGQH